VCGPAYSDGMEWLTLESCHNATFQRSFLTQTSASDAAKQCYRPFWEIWAVFMGNIARPCTGKARSVPCQLSRRVVGISFDLGRAES
jgi:hypothetical protein